MEFLTIFSATVLTMAILVVTIIFLLLKNRKLNKDYFTKEIKIEERGKEMDSKMYELAILKELGDRVGYSLDVHQIMDVITGSLHQFLNYTAVSYMLFDSNKILFKMHLEKSVNKEFIDEIKSRMLKSLGALLDKEITNIQIDELNSGAIINEEVSDSVKSYFNIPIVITGKVVGLLTVADTQNGLYKEDEMTILYKITNQASLAVTKLQEVVTIEKSKLNAMVLSMADGIVMTDLDYRILVINPAARQTLNIDQYKEVTIFDFIDNLGGKFDIRGRLEESIKFKKEYSSERILLGEKFFQIFVLPVKSSSIMGQESITGGVVIFHDVTSEVEIETLRKDFTSMLVHELRSPLDGVKKISEVLKNKNIIQTPESFDEYIDLIYRNSSGMLEIVNDILDVAKIEAGKFDIQKNEGDFVKIVKDRISFYSITANSINIKLQTTFGLGIPEKIMFDKEGLEHILNNLISNALKYTNKDGFVDVVTFLHQNGCSISNEAKLAGYHSNLALPSDLGQGDFMVVTVSDNGIGIEEENIKAIFSKFKQLDTKNKIPKKKGTGLGLVIAKGITEEHGGSIGVVSKVGVGSTFYFTIPLS